MKKGVIVTAAVLSFFVLAIMANAEMKITPNQITSPDDSAVHLSGVFSTRGFSPAPYGAVISGLNSYSGNYYSCGGYFSASGTIGVGVHGEASHTGSIHNYGGYFEASGKYGDGVFGSCLGTNCAGVQAVASGTYGIGVKSSGGEYDFCAGGPGVNYGAFTGAHEVKFSGGMPEGIVPGMIVSVTGKTEARKDKNGVISLSSTLPTVAISTKAKDKAVFGVIVSDGPLPEDHWYETQEGERFGVVNALGEGRVWVTDINGDIQAGDYITTSSVPGYGQIQDDDLLHSYTLGKAIETINGDQVAETFQQDGKTYKRHLIAVVYTSG